MNDYNWCHGPECHTQETQSREQNNTDYITQDTVTQQITQDEEPNNKKQCSPPGRGPCRWHGAYFLCVNVFVHLHDF